MRENLLSQLNVRQKNASSKNNFQYQEVYFSLVKCHHFDELDKGTVVSFDLAAELRFSKSLGSVSQVKVDLFLISLLLKCLLVGMKS